MSRLVILLLSLGLVSCTDVVELDLDQQVRTLAIDGRVTDSSETSVTLSITGDYLQNGSVERIQNAAVYLFEDGVLATEMLHDSNGVFQSDFRGQVGSSYHLEIELSEEYDLPLSWTTSPTVMQRLSEPDSLEVRELSRTTRPAAFEAGAYALLYFKDPEGLGDFYRFKRWVNDTALISSIFTFSDENTDGRSFGYPSEGESELTALPPFGIYGPLEASDKLVLEVGSISEDHYEYLQLVSAQVFQVGSPFDAPPTEIIGNLRQADRPEEYGYGYFLASSTRTLELEYQP